MKLSLFFKATKEFGNSFKCQCVATLLGNPKGRVKQGNRNTCAAVELHLFLFMPALEKVCRDTEVLNTISFD